MIRQTGEVMSHPGLAIKAQTPGIQVATGTFDKILSGLRRGLRTAFPADTPECVWGPPVISAADMERLGYGRSFPQLLGTVSVAPDLTATQEDLALVASACHHVYPLYAGKEISAPTSMMVEGWCFRNDSPGETGRLRSFRQREVVHIAEPDLCATWRAETLESVEKWLRDLGIEVIREAADDPFFGRGSRMLKAKQRDQYLKWEFRADLGDGVRAIGSSNYHKGHFSSAFGFHGQDRKEVHTSCIGFGLERLVLALVNVHGEDLANWPEYLRIDSTIDA